MTSPVKIKTTYKKYQGTPVLGTDGNPILIEVVVVQEQHTKDIEGNNVILTHEERALPNVTLEQTKNALIKQREQTVFNHEQVLETQKEELAEIDANIVTIEGYIAGE